MGLATRITILTFIAVTAAAGLVSVISLAGVFQSVRAEETARLQTFQRMVASSLDSRITGAEDSLDLLASEAATVTVGSLSSQLQLDEMLEARSATFDALAFADSTGVIASSGGIGRSAPRSVLSAVAAVTPGTPVVVWDRGPAEGRLWVAMTTSEGTRTVTLAARTRPEYLTRTMDDVARASGAMIAVVVDRSGRTVLSAAAATPIDTGTLTLSGAEMGATHGTAGARASGLGAVSGPWETLSPDRGLGWRVLAVEPDVNVLLRSEQALAPAALAMLVVVLAAVLAALLYSRRLLVPLTVFEKRARDVAAGGYIRPLRVVRDDEMGRVAEAFNDMGVRLNSLQDMAQLLATASDLEHVLDAVLGAIGRILGTGDAAVLLADPAGLGLSLVRGRGLATADETLMVPLDAPSSIAPACLSKEAVAFAGGGSDGSSAVHRLFGADAMRGGVAVPLAVDSEVIGVVVVLAPGRRAFTEAQIETLRAFGANAAVAVRTSRVFAEERSSRTEAEALRSIAELIVRPGDLGRALESVAALAASVLGYGDSAVAVDGRRLLGIEAAADQEGEQRLLDVWRAIETARDRGTSADAPVAIEDARRAPEVLAAMGPIWGSALFIPILQGSVARGVLVLHDRKRMHRLDERQIALAATIGQQVSLAMSNAHALRQARTRAANLENVFRITQVVSSELEVSAVLSSVLEVVQKLLSADAVALMSYDGQRHLVETSMARGLAGEMLLFASHPGEDIPGNVFESGAPMSFDLLSSHPTELARAASAAGFESMIGVPLLARGRPLGVLAVYSRALAAFSSEDVELLMTFAAQAALAIDTASLYGREHRVASVLQASILPERLPLVAGLESASFYLPCGPDAEIGGDYYDLIPGPAGRVALAIGDVCGKGVGAATKTSMVKYTLRGLLGAGASPAGALSELNRQVASTGDPADIVTMWVGVLDLDAGSLTYADGGHPPALLLRHGTRRVERLGATGPLLGAVADARYDERTAEFAEGDLMLLYTDGVTESRRGVRLFGEGRVRRVLRGSATAPGCVDALLAAVDSFAAGRLKDDAAALAIRRVAAPAEAGV
jgi:GAF domain-containing protein